MPNDLLPVTQAELSIIYVNWNSAHYLIQSIASVYEHTSGVDFEIIVVDNASPSGDAYLVKEKFPETRLITTPINVGFARANNIGFREASGPYILFLNPDTRLVNPAINLMLDELKSSPEGGAIGGKLLNRDLSIQTTAIQTFPTILNQILDTDVLRNRWPRSRLWGTAPLYSEAVDLAEVEVISGACLMIKREVFEKAGQFTESYFMYAEDLDLCYKVIGAGYKNIYTGSARVIHYGGGSSVRESATVMKWKSIIHYMVLNRRKGYATAFRVTMTAVAMARLTVIWVAERWRGTAADNGCSSYVKWKSILRTLLGCNGAEGARTVLCQTFKGPMQP